MKWLLGLFGGPAGWFMTAGSAAIEFCTKHWKLVLGAVFCAALVWFGDRNGSERVQAHWDKDKAARAAHDQLIDNEFERVVRELEASNQAVEEKAAKDKKNRDAEYVAIEKELKEYVARNSGGGTDIGAVGVQLVNRTIRARRAGAGQGN